MNNSRSYASVGDADKLREMILSVTQHVTDTHVFPDNVHVKVFLYW
jgi:hypothetical protein